MILTSSRELENIIQTLMQCQDVVASSSIRATAIRQGRVFQICHVEDVNIAKSCMTTERGLKKTWTMWFHLQ